MDELDHRVRHPPLPFPLPGPKPPPPRRDEERERIAARVWNWWR